MNYCYKRKYFSFAYTVVGIGQWDSRKTPMYQNHSAVYIACVQDSTNGTNCIPISFKFLLPEPLVIPLGEPRTEPVLIGCFFDILFYVHGIQLRPCPEGHLS